MSSWRSRMQPGARRAREAIARALEKPRRIEAIDRALSASLDYLLDCRKVRSELSNVHDDQLPEWRAKLVRAHLATCAVCSRVDESLRETVSMLHALRDQPVDVSESD